MKKLLIMVMALLVLMLSGCGKKIPTPAKCEYPELNLLPKVENMTFHGYNKCYLENNISIGKCMDLENVNKLRKKIKFQKIVIDGYEQKIIQYNKEYNTSK